MEAAAARRILPCVAALAALAALARGAIPEIKLAPEGHAERDSVGLDVALAGGSLAVGSDARFVAVFERDGRGAWAQTARIEAPHQDPDDDEFATRVAFAAGGERLLVGAPGASRVFAYERADDGRWAVIEDLAGPVASQFGQALAGVDSGVVAVGAPRANLALVFDPSLDSETVAVLDPPAEAGGGIMFGRALALAPDAGRLAVGAPSENDRRGAVYLYTAPTVGVSGNWTLEARLAAADLPTGAVFGRALSMGDATLLVGAPEASAAYVFQVPDAGDAPVELAFDDESMFGHSLALAPDGTAAVIGAYTCERAGDREQAGCSVFYRQRPGGWASQILVSQDAGDVDFAGFAVAMDGGTVAVGACFDSAPSESGDALLDAGSVSVFFPLANYALSADAFTVDIGTRGFGQLDEELTVLVEGNLDASEMVTYVQIVESSSAGPVSLEGATERVLEVGADALVLPDLVLRASPNVSVTISVSTVRNPAFVEMAASAVLSVAPCTAPYVSDDGDLSRCACVKGTSSNVAGVCEPCDLGTFKPDSGIQGCTACPAGTTTAVTGAILEEACICAPGTLQPASLDEPCAACPAGAVCGGGANVVAATGHWLLLRSDASPYLLRCTPDGRCLGNNTCATPFSSESIGCSKCADGYGAISQTCLKCPRSEINLALLVVGMAVSVTVIAVVLRTASDKTNKASIGAKGLINHLVILSLIAQFNDWPTALAAALGVASLLTPTSGITVDCIIAPTRLTQAAILMSLPVIIVVGVGIWFLVRGWDTRRWRHNVTILLVIAHPVVVQGALIPAQCDNLGPAGSRLRGDVDVECWSSTHVAYVVMASIHLLVYGLGLLIYLGVLLWRSHAGTDEDDGVVRFLADGYRPETRGWELVVLGKKLALMALGLLDTSGQIFFAQAVLLLSAYANARLRPFSSRSISNLEDAALLCLLMTLSSISVISPSDGAQVPDAVRLLVLWLVILINAAAIVSFVVYVVRERAKRGHHSADKRRLQELQQIESTASSDLSSEL